MPEISDQSAISWTYVTISFYNGRGSSPSDWRRHGTVAAIATHGAYVCRSPFVRTSKSRASRRAVSNAPPHISLTHFNGTTRLKTDPAPDGFNALKAGLRQPDGDADRCFSFPSFRRYQQEQTDRPTKLSPGGLTVTGRPRTRTFIRRRETRADRQVDRPAGLSGARRRV